jgi:hypothetical protein
VISTSDKSGKPLFLVLPGTTRLCCNHQIPQLLYARYPDVLHFIAIGAVDMTEPENPIVILGKLMPSFHAKFALVAGVLVMLSDFEESAKGTGH